MKNIALLLMRVTLGTLLAAHGAQKLFGWFGGSGLKGTAGMMEKLGMAPGSVWGTMAALGEFGGGVLTVLGLLWPAGPLNIMAAMAVAVRRAHWRLPIFASQGGAELAATNLAAAMTLAAIGPGDYSADRLLGVEIPRPLRVLIALFTAGAVYAALRRPEIGHHVAEATSRVTGTFTSTDQPDLEVETRPRQKTPTPPTPSPAR
jgi:putative oxidoreductase